MKKKYFKDKKDDGKLAWHLIDLTIIASIVHILSFGLIKYSKDSWKNVPDADDRYFSALMRHLEKHRQDEVYDKETGMPHLWHAFCNLYFLVGFQLKRLRGRIHIKVAKENISLNSRTEFK